MRAIWGALLLALCSTAPGAELVLRPRPQIVQRSAGDFLVTARSRIVIPENWPDYVKASARELAAAVGASLGTSPQVVEVGKPDVKKGDIVVAPYEWLARYLVFMEPTPQALVRPASAEGYTVRIVPSQVLLAGNSERGCFMGLQTLIQIARQGEKKEGGLDLRGVLISDWPTHGWRTLQHPFGVYGSAYDRGEHRYRHITRVALLERSVRLAAHHKLTGLCVEVGTGMAYDRSPEIFVEGFATNKRQDVKAAVDLAKSLGLALVPFQNVSAAHDIWIGPYAYAVPSSELYMEALYGIFDETLDVFRPAHFHIGLDEDVAKDFDERPLREVEMHRKVMLDCYEFLRRRGVSVLVWNDGVELLREGQATLPRDLIVLPWYYGGLDFTMAERYLGMGFRILCSPWSQWHVENDQFYSICASSIRSDRLLGMAGTIWYPISPDGEHDYRRCLVKAAMAFWSPLLAGDYPNDKEYFAPAYPGLPGDALLRRRPLRVPQAELPCLVELVAGPGKDHFACEAARERLVQAGASAVPALLKAVAAGAEEVSPWAEGTLRRLAREPGGERAALTKLLAEAAGQKGRLRGLALELLGELGAADVLEKEDPSDPAVCLAMGISGEKRFLPTLLPIASKDGIAQVNALSAIGRLKGVHELLSLKDSWKSFGRAAREAFAKALAMQAAEDAIPVLGDLGGDSNWRVRFRAAIGLGAPRSPKAGPLILKVLEDAQPEVFKVGLFWCTDTFILKPEEYFPKLIARLSLTEDREIVRPILHALTLMWDPGSGQWLSKGEDPARRLNYPALGVWKDRALLSALETMAGYKDHRLAMDAIMVLIKMGAGLGSESLLQAINQFSIEDKRWFCVRMRDSRAAQAAPILRKLWSLDDRLVRVFILQYCTAVRTSETFEIACAAHAGLPENHELRISAVGAMASHVQKLDEQARRAIPLFLECYNKGGFEARAQLDAALSRAAGRAPRATPNDEPDEIARRLEEWRTWWRGVGRAAH